jgi:hypothetical protein
VSMAITKKPVKRQINTAGAWRDVIRFDAANDIACGEVMAAAAALGRVGKARMRICTADSLQQALMHWTYERSAEHGWEVFK